MFLSLFTAFAVGMTFVVAIATVAIPFMLGSSDRRDHS